MCVISTLSSAALSSAEDLTVTDCATFQLFTVKLSEFFSTLMEELRPAASLIVTFPVGSLSSFIV